MCMSTFQVMAFHIKHMKEWEVGVGGEEENFNIISFAPHSIT
jgi:hypothetical protein